MDEMYIKVLFFNCGLIFLIFVTLLSKLGKSMSSLPPWSKIAPTPTSLVYIILIIQSRIIPLFHFNLVLFQIVLFYFTCSCKLMHKTQSHFLSKGTSYRVSKNSSKGIKRRHSWKDSLVANSRMLTPSSQSLWLSKQNVFIIFVKVWWNLSRAPWDSGWYALDWSCFMFNLIHA